MCRLTLEWAIWMLVAAAFMWLVRLWQHGITARNDLGVYIGMLLLSDEVRAAHQQHFEEWIQSSTENDALDLSAAALLALQESVNNFASAESRLAFHALVWKRKQELSKS